MKLNRNDILSVPHAQAIGFEKAKRFVCTGVSTDSRTIRSGDLFFAVRGDKFDGHNFLTKAVEVGAAGLVVDTKWAEANPILLSSLNVSLLIVEDTVRALGQLATNCRRHFRIPVLVVGGSNGKTTTKEMIRAVLGRKYNVLATEGNLNNSIGVPLTLLRLEKKHQIAVVEVGTNHFGEVTHLCSLIEPTHALVTNVGREHLEFFKSLAGVAKAEGEAFTWLRANRPKTGTSFVNADDTRLVKEARGLKKLFLYSFGTKGAVRGKLLSMNEQACALLEIKAKGKKPFTVQLSAPGAHNAQNALAAAAVGLFFRVPAAKIQKALSTFAGASKRMQIIRLDDATILNDTYNANPDSVLAAFETLRATSTSGKKIAVLADMLELGENAIDEHHRIGQAAAKAGVEYLLTYGTLAKHIHDAAATKFKAHYEQKNILSEYLAELLTDGDVVLVKGSRGMKMEDVVTFVTERAKEAHGTSDQAA